ncbi:hypothetical protein CONPUDRAFT_154571 [Coniophora puteana RWD-64-598 SS2]|uniref:Uncharacterized protein n=1 Tax=Coniophora puteana (strain RWD-64-598) TaxID=741705 RepID=A0A5M3MN63_CONPW|nr:uncharacterized protein CONPUDRAFT_154571 [Coniophora puteana RWD-64-598 SS2]EIW80543.1 hypothetical protein CONPUDRAFT_154571 [Coniophora puteana RWD-64-598 SS2]
MHTNGGLSMQLRRTCLNGIRKLRDRLIPSKRPYERPSNADIPRCFCIDELLELILDFVNDPASLASLARVCVALKEPAINALYTHLDNPFVVLMCLPHDLLAVVHEDSEADVPRRWVLVRNCPYFVVMHVG